MSLSLEDTSSLCFGSFGMPSKTVFELIINAEFCSYPADNELLFDGVPFGSFLWILEYSCPNTPPFCWNYRTSILLFERTI